MSKIDYSAKSRITELLDKRSFWAILTSLIAISGSGMSEMDVRGRTGQWAVEARRAMSLVCMGKISCTKLNGFFLSDPWTDFDQSWLHSRTQASSMCLAGLVLSQFLFYFCWPRIKPKTKTEESIFCWFLFFKPSFQNFKLPGSRQYWALKANLCIVESCQPDLSITRQLRHGNGNIRKNLEPKQTVLNQHMYLNLFELK